MSILFGKAMAQAYPEQPGRFRPSNAGNCALNVAASIAGIPADNLNSHTIIQQQLGLAGQDIVTKALPFLGLDVIEVIRETTGPVPGEIDLELEFKPHNPWGLDPAEYGRILGDVKFRSTYAFNHVFAPEGDMMEVDATVGMQMVMYMGQRGLKHCLLMLFPFDGSATRNDRVKKWPDASTYVRFLFFPFNSELFMLGLQRKAAIEEFGVGIGAEYDPFKGKFPCTYCRVWNWCKAHWGDEVKGYAPELPSVGLPYTELLIP